MTEKQTPKLTDHYLKDIIGKCQFVPKPLTVSMDPGEMSNLCKQALEADALRPKLEAWKRYARASEFCRQLPSTGPWTRPYAELEAAQKALIALGENP